MFREHSTAGASAGEAHLFRGPGTASFVCMNPKVISAWWTSWPSSGRTFPGPPGVTGLSVRVTGRARRDAYLKTCLASRVSCSGGCHTCLMCELARKLIGPLARANMPCAHPFRAVSRWDGAWVACVVRIVRLRAWLERGRWTRSCRLRVWVSLAMLATCGPCHPNIGDERFLQKL